MKENSILDALAMDRLTVLSAATIVGDVCRVSVRAILSKSRQRHLVDVRTVIACHLLSIGWTVSRTAKAMGRSHATVIRHRQRAADLQEACPSFRRFYSRAMEALEKKLNI